MTPLVLIITLVLIVLKAPTTTKDRRRKIHRIVGVDGDRASGTTVAVGRFTV